MNCHERTRELLIAHVQSYPQSQIQDVFKYLHQSAFGCEHLVSSLDAAEAYINREYAQVDRAAPPLIEPLDGGYSRVHLSCLNTGSSAGTLARYFFLSAKREPNAAVELTQKLEIAKKLVSEHLLPFSTEEFKSAVEEWKNTGYPALHHSDAFRNAYHPAYRVIANEFIPQLSLSPVQ